MRNFILSAAVLVGSFANAGVPDMRPMPLPGPRTAVFDYININNGWGIKDLVVGGSVTMNYVDGTLAITLKVSNCPKNALCIVPTEIKEQTYEAPIVDTKTDDCGAVIVTAKKDQRPVDGALVKIQLTDNTNMTCETLAPLKGTTVNFVEKFYDRRDGKEVILRANFAGPVLQ